MTKIILKLKNPYTGKIKTAPLGFSWTVLLFGFFVPLYRKDWGTAFLMLFFYIITLGFASIVFAFTYNKIYAQKLFNKEYDLLYFYGKLNYRTLYKLRTNSFSDD